MKKIIALILSLCLLVPCAVLAVSAEVGYTLSFEGEGAPDSMSGATTYVLPSPTAPEGKVFAGWQGQLDGANVFLPADAEVTLTADATLTAVYVGIAMRKDPQIRYDIEGMRFLTKIDKTDLAALQQYTEVGYGTLITPKDHLSKTKSLTHAVLAASGKSYLDVVTAGAYAEDEETVWLAGSIGHVKTKNFCRTLLAAGYLSLTYSDGSTGYVYAPVKQTDAPAYLYQLSANAFDKAEAAEQTFLKRVMNAVVDLTLTCDKSNHITNIAYGPAAASYRPAYTARYEKLSERIVVTVVQDSGLNYGAEYAAVILDGHIYDAAFDHDAKQVSISGDGSYLHVNWRGEYTEFY